MHVVSYFYTRLQSIACLPLYHVFIYFLNSCNILGGRAPCRCSACNDMDMSEADPYEQQLRAVFESFDTSSVGSLDHKGLKQLCEQLPLDRNQSADLVSSLLQDETARINFSQFWDGLLNLLGGGWNSSCAEGSSTEKNKDAEVNSDRGDSPGKIALNWY